LVTKNNKTIISGLTAAIIFVLIGVFFLSYAMETLDVKADELGAEENPIYEPPLPDYVIPGLDNPLVSALLGIASTLLIFGVALAVAKLLNKKKKSGTA
jgi:ABC-type antimicrobial peptide transport system permease subunit